MGRGRARKFRTGPCHRSPRRAAHHQPAYRASVADCLPADGLPGRRRLPADGRLHANPEKDILKIVVVNRYQPNRPVAKSFIRGFGLRRGALASSVAHDSHNIVAVGIDDDSICRAVNLVIAHQGGLACVDPGFAKASATPGASSTPDASSTPGASATSRATAELILPLPVGGLMSPDEGHLVADAYTAIDRLAKDLGCPRAAPFMTLSFMALLSSSPTSSSATSASSTATSSCCSNGKTGHPLVSIPDAHALLTTIND